MTWREYHELTKHSVESLRRTQHYLDWANMPNPFRHYEGVAILDFPADSADSSDVRSSLLIFLALPGKSASRQIHPAYATILNE
jgi:hypothetical protein